MAKIYLAVRHFTGKKKPRLVLEVGNAGIVIATFRNEEMAEAWKRALNCGCAVVFENSNIDTLDDLLEGKE